MMVVSYKLTKRTTKTEKIGKSLKIFKLFNVINFKIFRIKLTLLDKSFIEPSIQAYETSHHSMAS